MKKRVLSLILATMLMAALASCNQAEAVVEPDSQVEESESEESEEEVIEEESQDAHDASAHPIAHTEEIAGEISCVNNDFTVGVKLLEGYEVASWDVDDFGYPKYMLQNDTYSIYYKVFEGNIDEIYATDFEQIYDPYDTDHYLLDGVEVFETGELQNSDSKPVYYEVENTTFGGEEYYTWLVYYWQVDENHYMYVNVETVAVDEKGYVLDINEFVDLTQECYFVTE